MVVVRGMNQTEQLSTGTRNGVTSHILFAETVSNPRLIYTLYTLYNLPLIDHLEIFRVIIRECEMDPKNPTGKFYKTQNQWVGFFHTGLSLTWYLSCMWKENYLRGALYVESTHVKHSKHWLHYYIQFCWTTFVLRRLLHFASNHWIWLRRSGRCHAKDERYLDS